MCRSSRCSGTETSQIGHGAKAQVAAFAACLASLSVRDASAVCVAFEAAASKAAWQPAHEGALEKWAFFASTPQSGFPSGPLACFPLTLFFFFWTLPACNDWTDRHCEQVGGSANLTSWGWAPQRGWPSGPGACPWPGPVLLRWRGLCSAWSWFSCMGSQRGLGCGSWCGDCSRPGPGPKRPPR